MGATYGYDEYGNSTYGPSAPTGNYPGSQITIPVVNTAFVFPGMAATVVNYGEILVTWGPLNTGTNNTITEFRLISNTWGFPVDQNDGTAVIDSTGAPPVYPYQYVDTSASPGSVQYYGIYVLANGTWLRGGFAAALMPRYYGYDVKLMADLPAFFQNQDLGIATSDVAVPAPSFPSSGGTITSPYNYDVDVWLSQSANVAVNGLPQGTVTLFTIPALGSVTITYSTGTTWQWISRAQQTSNNALAEFLAIVGMGLDLVKSQADLKFSSLNSPMTMSLGDLANFCQEIGLPYNPEIPAYTMRKAALFWGRVMMERGTLGGVAEHITLLTGFLADVQTSRNIMLDNDQSVPVSIQYPSWNANTHYNVGEMVTFPVPQPWSVVSVYNVGSVVQYNDLLYTCTVANTTMVPPTNGSFWSQNVNGPYLYYCLVANENNQPSGSTSANTWWTCVYGSDQNGVAFAENMIIPDIGSDAGTWEFLDATAANYAEGVGVGFPTPQTWVQGGSTPTTGPNGFSKTIRAKNNTGGTLTNTWLRSVARSAADITATRLTPDPQLVVEHAVPVPVDDDPWSAGTTYFTNEIVAYQNVNYIARRQSTGATPPSLQAVLNQNYDFETAITPWTGGTGATVTQSAAQAYHGTHSMSIVTTGANEFAKSEAITVIPGATYQGTALVFASSGTPTVSLAVAQNDAYGASLAGVTPAGTTLATSVWTAVSVLFTVPNNAATVVLEPTIAAASTTFWDLVELTCVATPEWAALGQDTRMPLTVSGYAVADLGFSPTTSTTVTPFAEFYDNWGNIITRVFARSTSSAGGYPANYQYDAFNTGAGFPLSGRTPAIPSTVWSVPVGSWTISSYGVVYAGTFDADALGVVPSAAAGVSAATVTTAAQAGDDCGPLFWYSNTSNFWVAGLLQLYYVASATTRTVAYTGALPAVGDRIYAEFNNTTSTTTMPDGTHTVVGPSVIVYKNKRTTSNILVVVGSGGTQTQTSMGSLTTPFLPSTGATSSNAGIASIAV